MYNGAFMHTYIKAVQPLYRYDLVILMYICMRSHRYMYIWALLISHILHGVYIGNTAICNLCLEIILGLLAPLVPLGIKKE